MTRFRLRDFGDGSSRYDVSNASTAPPSSGKLVRWRGGSRLSVNSQSTAPSQSEVVCRRRQSVLCKRAIKESMYHQAWHFGPSCRSWLCTIVNTYLSLGYVIRHRISSFICVNSLWHKKLQQLNKYWTRNSLACTLCLQNICSKQLLIDCAVYYPWPWIIAWLQIRMHAHVHFTCKCRG